ncbi:MAG: bifunctional metallophosphatase/5'-nucleotidase [Chloroflexota bacterium]|nr:bifunctional metallophosphatase/5'-nucleotidase [Chloroflexota bacterium]
MSNVENFSAILDGLRRQFPDNTLVVSSGDNYIPGPRYYAAADPVNDPVLGISREGRGDIALLNAMGFQASALGNHELDRGTSSFVSQIAHEEGEGVYPGARFPYLSGNLLFDNDKNLAPLVVGDGQEAMLAGGSLAGSAVITVGGERIGIVGATTTWLASLTISGDITILPEDRAVPSDLASFIQPKVDALTEQGINKIIPLAHMQQIAIEKELATLLSDVDIIVAGGSNTLLSDQTDRLWPGDVSEGNYPLLFKSASGDPVLLVNTDGDYKYLGRLVVDFDDSGLVVPDSIDPFLSGVYATNPQGGHRFVGEPIPEVAEIAESLRGVLRERDGNIFGSTSVYLNGVRRSVRTEETNLGNLIADSFLWSARQVDPEVAVALKNSGGIRDEIGLVYQPPGSNDPSEFQLLPPRANLEIGKEAGSISQLDIQGTLRFNNGIVIVSLTAAEFLAIMEHSVSAEGVGHTASGLFPQVAGMRFSFDPTSPSGGRIRSLATVDQDGVTTDRLVEEGELVGDPGRRIKMATMNFLVDGGSGFPFPKSATGRVNLYGSTDHDASHVRSSGEITSNPGGAGILGPGVADFAEPGTEQDALAEYLALHLTEQPYANADTFREYDSRVQNLAIPGVHDEVFYK